MQNPADFSEFGGDCGEADLWVREGVSGTGSESGSSSIKVAATVGRVRVGY